MSLAAFEKPVEAGMLKRTMKEGIWFFGGRRNGLERAALMLAGILVAFPADAARPVLRVGGMDAKRQRQVYAEFVRQESTRVKDVRFRVIRELDAGRYGVSLTGGDELDAIVFAKVEAPFEAESMVRGLLYPEGTEMLNLLRHVPAYRLLISLDLEGRQRDLEASAERAVEALAAETSFDEWMDSLRRGGATQLTFTKEEKCRECSGWGRVTQPDSAARRKGSVHKGNPGPDGKVPCGVCKGKGVIAREVVYHVRY